MQLDDEGVSRIPKRPLRYKKTPWTREAPCENQNTDKNDRRNSREQAKGGNAYLLPLFSLMAPIAPLDAGID